MKCLCGYEYEWDWDNENQKEKVTGDEEFININGNFTIKSSGYYRDLIEVQIVSCPKCGTLQMVK